MNADADSEVGDLLGGLAEMGGRMILSSRTTLSVADEAVLVEKIYNSSVLVAAGSMMYKFASYNIQMLRNEGAFKSQKNSP